MAGLGGSLALSLRQLADEGGPQHQGRAHGALDLPGAIMQSCNCYFFEAGRRAGAAALAETAAPASLQLATAHGYRNVPVTDVLFLERILRKTRVVLTDGEELVTAAPAALLEAVPDGVFLRCHQSYWANFSHITAMEKDEFVLTGGLRVPISRSYRSAARSAFFANLRGEEG